jgi:hypothetical protein
MPISSAASPNQAVASSVMQSLQVQAAQRNAEQARQAARSLQAEAAQAEAAADQADQRARNLGLQAQQAQNLATRADQNLVSAQTGVRMQSQLGQLQSSVHQATQTLQPTKTPTAVAPVINTQGQTTGQVVNVKV